jgi:hypothetical protein
MKNQSSNPTSAITTPSATPSSDQSFLITYWLGLYEGFLFLNSPHGTYERYSRALSKFYGHFPGKRFTYEFLRPDIETYKAQRLQEGASATTVNIELSIVRGFWKWMLEMEADGVMFNPAVGVRVRVAKSEANVASRDALKTFPSTTL